MKPRSILSAITFGILVMPVLVLCLAGCNPSADATADSEPAKSETSASAPESRDPNRLWCNEHGLYEDECTICHPELAEHTQSRDPDRLWCNEHGVYEDECTICHPELANDSQKRDPDRLWCNEHGVYEDECTICHPELSEQAQPRDPDRLWCNEHGVYEDECTICHPELAGNTAHDPEIPSGGLWCKEHGVSESECGICHPEILTDLRPGQGLKVRFASARSAQMAGVRTGRPSIGEVTERVELVGQVSYNQNKLAIITPLAGGILTKVHVDVGESVEEGQLLAEVTSPQVADAKSAYLKALAQSKLHRQTYRREKDLFEQEISARQDYEEAQSRFESAQSETEQARQRLLNLGLTEAEIEKAAKNESGTSTLPIRAPYAATIVEREAVAGSAVDAGHPLFRIADLSEMWLELSVPENRIAALRTGMSVTVRCEAMPGEAFTGKLTWIASRVNPDTRTLEARAVLPSSEGLLKDGLFAKAEVRESTVAHGLTVPKEAVQSVDGLPIVFAKLEEDLYETRLVRPGQEGGGRVAILEGLSQQDEIVVAESYVMKSELLKARLGAGCVHE